MSNRKLKVAVCQLRTEIKQAETMAKAEKMIAEAAENGADIVVLPEMFNCPYSGEYFRKLASKGHEATVAEMSRWARENNIILVGGSIPELDGDDIYNTSFVFDRCGVQIAKHRKVHLFDVDIPGMRFKESNTFEPGQQITVFDTEYGKMGLAICFDVRFPELFRAMAVRGAQIIFLPAQFNMTTGPAHWDATIKIRAVDNELFFVAASAARYEGFSYECWGHSAVIDPYGTVLASCDEKEQIIYAEVNLDRIDEVRRQLPTFNCLRREIYNVAE